MSTNWLHDLFFGSNESAIKALEKLQQMDAEQFQKVQKYLDGLQEKVETLTETAADQEKTMIACIAVSAVAGIAITSFVVFCIYQGIKLEREKEKNLSKDTPGTELNNLGKSNTPGTKLDADGGTKLSNLEVNGSKSVNNIAA